MTVYEKLVSGLVDQGMFESQAKEVMEMAMPELNKVADDHKIAYNQDHDHYPAIMYTVWSMSVNRVALEWIKKHKPQAWYRPTFEKYEA